MVTELRLNQSARLLAKAARKPEPAPASPESASAEPLIAALINNGDVLAAIDAGGGLTTEQVIARLGLLPTVPLQLRMARALGELGYFHAIVRVNPKPGRAARVWLPVRPEPPTMPPAAPVSDYARRVHSPARRRPGLIARLLRRLRGLN